MRVTKPVGQGAAARKYDLLTSLGAHALSRGKAQQRTALRLITLITARYNWTRDELCVGQREIARMWSCDERTVKREMARLRSAGWLVLTRPGARGRVAEYRLGMEAILSDTAGDRPRVGPDFALRLETPPSTENVVSFPAQPAPPDVATGTEWALTQSVLHAEMPDTYGAWLARLTRGGRAGGRLTLSAPSRFHGAYVATHLAEAILRACQSVDPEVSEVVIEA